METLKELQIDDNDLFGQYTWNEGKKKIKLLNDQNYKSFSNWRLPTKEELNEMYLNKNEIGGFSNNYYWSSSKFNIIYAWVQFFLDGIQSSSSKDYNYGLIRCVRSI